MTTIELKHYLMKNCVSKDSTRKNLQHTYCDGENLIATNGKVLAFFPAASLPQPLEKGFCVQHTTGSGKSKTSQYLPADQSIQTLIYPNYKQAIPNFSNQPNVTRMTYKPDQTTPLHDVFELLHAVASASRGTHFLTEEPLTMLMKTYNIKWDVVFAPGSPVVFTHEDITLVLGACVTVANSPLRTIFKQTQPAPPDKSVPQPASPEPPAAKALAATTPKTTSSTAKPKSPANNCQLSTVNCQLPPKAATPRPEYRCTLKDGSVIILQGIQAVKKRRNIVSCQPMTKIAKNHRSARRSRRGRAA